MDDEISFRDSNDGAYTTEETRKGPPLSYISEKLGHGLQFTHALITTVPGLKDDWAIMDARHAFHYQLVAFLALHNMLAYANEKSAKDRLLSLSTDQFKKWLQDVESKGSVTG
jgi:hypothetical protein